jgi:2-polyprenyl-6-methoxyphenol hydroxylase-like FAD-dependent oxidoreductase
MSRTPVLIVGAGPTGLVLALWLTKAGVPVRIIDKTPEPGTTSRALAVQARTLELYSQMGIATAVLTLGVRVAGVNLWVKGDRAARIPFIDIGGGLSPFPYLLVFAQDYHELLLVDHLEKLGVRVERETSLVSFEQDANGVRALIERADGSSEQCEASYIAGCDGAHSKVREMLAIGFPGGTYDELFYVADVEASGPAVNGELNIDVDNADFLAIFPLQGEGHVRLIGTVNAPPGQEQRTPTFADVGARAVAQMRLAVSNVNWFSTYRVHHRVANSFRSNRAFLLGDAAHIHSPAGGQGMNTGIGDAVNLAWKLAAVMNGEATARLLDSYEPERIAFARKLVATTDRLFTFATSRGWLAAFVRTRIVPVLVPMLFRLKRLRRFMFTTVSQIGVAYPESFLSVGRAGGVRAGDRLPWVETTLEESNFTPLESMTWQAHIYGEPRVSAKAACGELELPLHLFPWTPEAKRAGLMRSAFYLVRPDGYVALADADGGANGLRRYLSERELRPRPPR